MANTRINARLSRHWDHPGLCHYLLFVFFLLYLKLSSCFKAFKSVSSFVLTVSELLCIFAPCFVALYVLYLQTDTTLYQDLLKTQSRTKMCKPILLRWCVCWLRPRLSANVFVAINFQNFIRSGRVYKYFTNSVLSLVRGLIYSYMVVFDPFCSSNSN